MLLPSFVSWWLSIVICSVFPFFFLYLCSRLLLCSYHDVYLHKTSCEWKMLPAAAAKLLQSCLSLCDPIDSSPLGSPSLGFSGQDHWSELPFPSPVHESENESEVAQSCLTPSDPMDCRLPGSSVRGIFQARVLEWVAIVYSKMLPAISVNKGCCSHQATTVCPDGEPWEKSGWRQMGCPVPSPEPLQPTPELYPEGTQDGKEQDTRPR